MRDLSGQPVLVTGGAGFIGSHLVEALVARGARVTVVDSLSSGYESNLRAVLAHIDLRVLDLAHDDLRPLLVERGFKLIFHLAATAYVPTSVEDPRSDFVSNATGTFELLEAARAEAPEALLINTSSAAVYGQGVRVPIKEDHPTVPVAPYGVSKLTAELYVTVFAQLFGLRAANVRLFPVYGPRLRKQVVYDLIRKVHESPEELFIYGDGTQVRDFNHVANVIEALLLIADRTSGDGEVYNVAAHEPVAIRDLALMICERMGASPRFTYSGDVRPGDVQRWRADTTRLAALGYRSRLGLADGLTDTVAWYREEMAIA